MIGKKIIICQNTPTSERQKVTVLDIITVGKHITKYDEYDCKERGINFYGGDNLLGVVPITAYLCETEDKKVIKVYPNEIKEIVYE